MSVSTTTANNLNVSSTSAKGWVRRAGLATAAPTLAVTGFAPVSQAATTTYSTANLVAEVRGNGVTASVAVTASSSVTAQKLNVCVRTSNGGNADFPPALDVALNPTGTHTPTKTFPVGSYSYFGCVKVADVWQPVTGAPKSFTVTATTAPTTDTSDGKMPTTSTKAGWAYSYGQDFTTPAPIGSFSRLYGKSWAGYVGVRNDTSRNGSYQPDKVLSVANGQLDMALGYEASTGQFNVASPFPTPPAGVNGGSIDYLGMRTSIRFTSSGPIPGYKTAWMLWPGSWNWNDGEIDFPEGPLDGGIGGFAHQANTGNPQLNTLWMHSPNTFYDGWHTATTEWIPGKSVEFFLDGVSVGKTTSHVPTKPMHWALQTETKLGTTPPPTTSKGNIKIDWLTVESYKP